MTDRDVIEAIKKGDQSALKFVYSHNRLDFVAYARKFPISEDDIIDVYQDAIIALHENTLKGNLDNLKSKLKTYLFSIGKFMIYNKLKLQQKMHLIGNDFIFTKYESDFVYDIPLNELTSNQKQLHRAFKALGMKCKEILTMFYYRGFDLEDIMIALNYSNKDVVKSQKSRCLKSLKKLILKNKS